MDRYKPADIEPKWQAAWSAQNLYAATDFADKPKYYLLTEFPYPSGDGLHLGHCREYTLGDIMARHKRMQGYNVLFPMGYDAFGLPTENYAIKHRIAPQLATDRNVANFRKQFDSLGLSIDWSRSFKTSDPDYYKWTQWLFLQFFEAGLAYQAETTINWCPFEKTGLANEEVVNGRHERCDTPVEKKTLKQWLLAITQYADRLIDGLDGVDYPSRIADQQVNWIGRSQGAEITFDVLNEKITVFTTRPDTIYGATFLVLAPEHPLVETITTAAQKPHVNSYVKAAAAKSDIERQDTNRDKTGVFTGAYATNPATNEEIPVWIADYVLNGYGTGAIMAVPAHDERDAAFAAKFELPVVPVVTASFNVYDQAAIDRPTVLALARDPATDRYCVLNWQPNPAAHNKIGFEIPGGGIDVGESVTAAALREFAEETGYVDASVDDVLPAAFSVYYHSGPQKISKRAIKQIALLTLNSDKRDENVHREAYEEGYEVSWVTKDELLQLEFQADNQAALRAVFEHEVFHGEGTMINSGPYNNLPSADVREKVVADLQQSGLAKAVTTYRLRDWIFSRQHYWGEPIPIIHCPEHGAVAVPADQLPVTLPEVERYQPTDDGQSPLAAITDWVNTTCPQCDQPAKRETDTMPNWAGSSWYYLRYMDAHNDQVFAARDKMEYWGEVDLYLGGMEHTTLHLLYSRFWHEFLYDRGLLPRPEPYAARRGQGIVLAADGTKMSKSKGNVVNPTEIISSGYGADAIRLSIAFLAPYDQTTPWSPEGVAGTYRLLNRVWTLVQDYEAAADGSVDYGRELQRASHAAIKRVSLDLQEMGFNTAVAGLMEFVNTLYKLGYREGKPVIVRTADWQTALISLLQLLAPFAPHVSEELWQQMGRTGSVHISGWPEFDDAAIQSELITLAVQVNGKVRTTIDVEPTAEQTIVVAVARQDSKVLAALNGQEPRKIVYVPGRILNFVV